MATTAELLAETDAAISKVLAHGTQLGTAGDYRTMPGLAELMATRKTLTVILEAESQASGSGPPINIGVRKFGQ